MQRVIEDIRSLLAVDEVKRSIRVKNIVFERCRQLVYQWKKIIHSKIKSEILHSRISETNLKSRAHKVWGVIANHIKWAKISNGTK